MMQYLYIVLCLSMVSAQSMTSASPSAQSLTPVDTNGFTDDNMNTTHKEESWLKQHDRYVFIIVLCVVFLAVVLWYVIRSMCGMRRRMAAQNNGQMMQESGFHKMPDYPGQPPQQYNHRY